MPRKRRSSKGSKAVASLVSNEPLDSLERDAVSTFFAGKSLFLTGATGFLGKVRTAASLCGRVPQVPPRHPLRAAPAAAAVSLDPRRNAGALFCLRSPPAFRPPSLQVMIEKLLRSTPDIGTIYVLVREKKRGKEIWSAQRRLNEELLNSRVFARVKQAYPEFGRKIVGVTGDISAPGLGLSQADHDAIVDNVTVVLHMAATVNFTEPIKNAHELNIEGMRKVMSLAQEIHETGRLKSVVHTSTCYVNSLHYHLEGAPELCREELVPWEHDYAEFEEECKALTKGADEKAKTPGMLAKYGRPETGSWPNTYTITKRIAEEVLRVEFAEADPTFPISVVRPSIIGPALYEPMPGWGDAMSCVAGPLLGAWIGVLHAFPCDSTMIFDFVPVDLVSNAILVSAWHRAAADEGEIEALLSSDDAATVAVWGAGRVEPEARIARTEFDGVAMVPSDVPVVQVSVMYRSI